MPEYNKYLKEMIANSEAKVKAMNGFEPKQIAEPVDVKNFNYFADPWNPLYNDEEYAKNTRYGRVPAFPSFFEWMSDSVHLPSMDERGGFSFGMYAGENFEIYKPVYPGDEINVYHHPSKLTDITDAVKDIPQEYLSWPKHLPIFSWSEQDLDIYNGAGEKVANFQHYNDVTIFEGALDNEKIAENLPYKKHYYTKEDWEYIDGIIAGEKIRGAEPRYWEDVNIGDELTPNTVGPTTIWDMICHLARCAMPKETPLHPLRKQRELMDLPVDPATNNYKHFIGMHIWDPEIAKKGAMPGPFHFGNYGRNVLMRLITNWIGDDGEIRKFKWRHMRMTPIGDCQIARGRVVDKKIENGEALVEIEMWLDNVCLGNVTEGGRTWVKLPTKNEITADVPSVAVKAEKKFQLGDKVVIKDRKGRMLPGGDPLAGAKAEIIAAIYPWHLCYLDFDGYVAIKITDDKIKFGLGDTLLIREEDLEKA